MEIAFSELFNLGLGLAMLPLILSATSADPQLPRGRRFFLAGYVAVLASYGLTVLEGVGGQLGDVLNFLEHFALLFAGVLTAIAAFQLRESVLEERKS